ncbi:MAG: Uncharacterized DUF349-containing protein SCO1511, partial [uncultured Frankineae bacterium]
ERVRQDRRRRHRLRAHARRRAGRRLLAGRDAGGGPGPLRPPVRGDLDRGRPAGAAAALGRRRPAAGGAERDPAQEDGPDRRGRRRPGRPRAPRRRAAGEDGRRGGGGPGGQGRGARPGRGGQDGAGRGGRAPGRHLRVEDQRRAPADPRRRLEAPAPPRAQGRGRALAARRRGPQALHRAAHGALRRPRAAAQRLAGAQGEAHRRGREPVVLDRVGTDRRALQGAHGRVEDGGARAPRRRGHAVDPLQGGPGRVLLGPQRPLLGAGRGAARQPEGQGGDPRRGRDDRPGAGRRPGQGSAAHAAGPLGGGRQGAPRRHALARGPDERRGGQGPLGRRRPLRTLGRVAVHRQAAGEGRGARGQARPGARGRPAHGRAGGRAHDAAPVAGPGGRVDLRRAGRGGRAGSGAGSGSQEEEHQRLGARGL